MSNLNDNEVYGLELPQGNDKVKPIDKQSKEKLESRYEQAKVNDMIHSVYAFKIMALVAKPSECHMDKLKTIEEYLRLMDMETP